MFTVAECRAKAKEKTELATRDLWHRRSLMSAAKAWAFLADRLEESDRIINSTDNSAQSD